MAATVSAEDVMQNMHGDDEDLSQELTEKLIHFQEITNIDDLARCKNLLRRHSWNVESAVQATFHDQSAPTNNVQGDAGHELQTDLRRRNIGVISPPIPLRTYPHTSVYEARRSHDRQPQGIFGWSYYILSLPFRFTWSTVFSLLRFFMRLFIPDHRARVTDPIGDVRAFIKEYEEEYGVRHPVFFQGSYADVQSESRRQMKFLLVYLHGPDHQDTPDFCRNTLSNNDVIELVQRNCLFWACSINSPEGYRVSRALRENTYPFLALICQYQGKMTVVGRLEGPLTPQEFLEQVSGIIGRFEPTMIAARADRAERDMTQQLRSEQDAAYQQSLLRDKEKEEKKRLEEENKRRKEEAIEEKEKRKLEAEQKYFDRKQFCKKALKDGPDPSHPDSVKLLIKLPDGSRLTRVFLSSEPVKNLHNFVFSQDNAPRQFLIVTNFPRRIIPGCSTEEVLRLEEEEREEVERTRLKIVYDDVGVNDQESEKSLPSQNDRWISIKEAGLKSAEMLFVQAIDDTDDEDSASER